jgi:hypothetical protein
MNEPQRVASRPVPSQAYLEACDDVIESLKFQLHIDRETFDALMAIQNSHYGQQLLMAGLQAAGLLPDEWPQDVAEG